MEFLEGVDLLADADQLDRGAGDGAHRQRRAAAGVAVHPGHHDAGDADRLVEGARGVHRVLAGHGVDHQQGLGRAGGGADGGHLVHQRLVDGQPAGGVEDDDVEHLAPGGIHGADGDLKRRLAGDNGQAGNAGLFGKLGELELGGRALGVETGQQHLLALPLGETQRQLAGRRGLAGALQADHEDGHRRDGAQVDRHGAGAAELLDHHVVDDLHHLLAGRDAGQHFLADGAFADVGDEVLHHGQGDVGVQQGEADLAQGVGDVGLVQRAAAAQAVEDAGETAGKAFEHADPNTIRAGARTLADRRVKAGLMGPGRRGVKVGAARLIKPAAEFILLHRTCCRPAGNTSAQGRTA